MKDIREEDIAIIGMAGRFPGANTIEKFWKNICEGRESIYQLHDDELLASGIDRSVFSQAHYVKAKGIIDQVEYFDATFFGMSALEAQILDPQHRMLLLCAYEACENAGFVPNQIRARVGVFASTGFSSYLLKNILYNTDFLKQVDEYQLLLSNDKDFLATRISYLLNLQGPSVTIQTGCSSSLVCVHYACQSLLNGECDLALAGGVSITIPQSQGYLYKKEMIGSPDGHCYAFDKRAQGTVKSNGAGIVLLKPLSNAIRDNDHIYAIICGTAINNDGANKVGYTAPSVTQQVAVIKEAMQMADVAPPLVEYIETHGTGTLLGDPIEIAALKQVYSAYQTMPESCALASLKTNIGHLDVAAGIASLIKASLAVYHGLIPASLNFKELNPNIDLCHSPFYINTELKKWDSRYACRYAGVSAFGIGGTNVHLILKQSLVKNEINKSETCHVFYFSAKTHQALQANINKITTYLSNYPNLSLSDVSYTLLHGREVMPYRIAVAADSHELLTKLTNIDIKHLEPIKKSRSLVFMFSGQGSQYAGMAKNLYIHEATFKYALDECISAFKAYVSYDLKKMIFLEDHPNQMNDQLKQTEIAQPALFAVEYALTKCFLSYGITPTALLGHSVGEYVAAVFSGIFTLEDAAKLIAIRGKLIQRLPQGSMLAVFINHQIVNSFLPNTIDIALINAPHITVVSGPTLDIQQFAEFLASKAIRYQLLQTSHAFHSRVLDEVLDEFGSVISNIKRSSPQLPIASNVTGKWLTEEQALSVNYWINQLRDTVQFAACIAMVQQQFSPLFIEIGPGLTLYNLVSQHGISKAIYSLPSAHDLNNDLYTFNQALATIWNEGIPIYKTNKGKRIPLPTYSWDLQYYWIDASPSQQKHPDNIIRDHSIFVDVMTIKDIWRKVLGRPPLSDEDHFFSMGGNSLSAIQLIHFLPTYLHAHVHVVHVYQYPKFGHFVRFIESIANSTKTQENIIKKVDVENHAEEQLFSIQEEL